MIKGQMGKLLRNLCIACNYSDMTFPKIVRNQPFKQYRKVRGKFTHFQHYIIASSQGLSQRTYS